METATASRPRRVPRVRSRLSAWTSAWMSAWMSALVSAWVPGLVSGWLAIGPAWAQGAASAPVAVSAPTPADWQARYDDGARRHALRDLPGAEAAARQALALARQFPATRQPPYVASSLNLLALVQRDRGQFEDAAGQLAQALALNEASLGVHANTAAVALNLATTLDALQRPREAAAALRRCLEIATALPDSPEAAELRRQSRRGLERLEGPEPLLRQARVLAAQGQADAAADLQRRALALGDAANPQDPALAEPLNELGLWHAARQEFTQADALLQRAQALVRRQVDAVAGPAGRAPDPAPDLTPDLARILASRAQVLEALARDDEARELNQQSLALYRALPQGSPTLWVGQAGVLNALAGQVYRKRRYKEAEPLFHEALGLMERALGPDDARLLPLLDNLQTLYRSQGRPAAATPYAQRAAALRRAVEAAASR